MAERDPNLPQSADPELQADLVRLLRVQGPLGMLNVLDVVIPTVSMGQVVPLNVQVRQPSFRSTDVFSAGVQTAAAANFVHADTGALAQGIYDVFYYISINATNSPEWQVQHRDAANAANLAVWSRLRRRDVGGPLEQTFGYEFGTDERLRILQTTNFDPGVRSNAVIFARRRT